MSANILQISAEQVRTVLNWPMMCEAVEEAMKVVSRNQDPESNVVQSSQPARSMTLCGDRTKVLLTMPGYVGNYQLTKENTKLSFKTLGCKLVTSFAKNSEREERLPNIMANILLFNTETGKLDCIIDGTDITAWRTAAASIIATKYLYFSRYPESFARPIKIAIIGTGVQGESHALGMIATFNVTDVFLWNRTQIKAKALEQKLLTQIPSIRVKVCLSAADAVFDADVICVGTYSPMALVTNSMIKKSHVHINTIGAGQVHFGEIGSDIYDQAKVYIDSWENAKTELNGLKAEIVAEVGEVINSEKFPLANKITIFQSMGMAAEDVTVAQTVYNAVRSF